MTKIDREANYVKSQNLKFKRASGIDRFSEDNIYDLAPGGVQRGLRCSPCGGVAKAKNAKNAKRENGKDSQKLLCVPCVLIYP